VKDALDAYEVSKGSIRFSPDNPVPEDSLKRLIAARAKEIAAAK
jgi:uncharacterized protein YdhG (YjbR/CyaY superfamily)